MNFYYQSEHIIYFTLVGLLVTISLGALWHIPWEKVKKYSILILYPLAFVTLFFLLFLVRWNNVDEFKLSGQFDLVNGKEASIIHFDSKNESRISNYIKYTILFEDFFNYKVQEATFYPRTSVNPFTENYSHQVTLKLSSGNNRIKKIYCLFKYQRGANHLSSYCMKCEGYKSNFKSTGYE